MTNARVLLRSMVTGRRLMLDGLMLRWLLRSMVTGRRPMAVDQGLRLLLRMRSV